MNIGIDLRSLGEGSIHRGIGTYVYNLLCSLALIDTKNCYYLFADKNQANYFLENLPHPANFNYIFLSGPRFRKRKFVRTFVIANKTLDVTPYQLDVFYQLDPMFPIKQHNTPIVTIVYDLIPQLYKDQYMKLTLHHKTHIGVIILLKDIRRYQLINKSLQTHKNATKVIAISECTKNDLVRLIGVEPKNIEAILLGADKINVTNKHSKPSSLSKYTKKPFFLYVGGADPRKGLMSMLEDFAEVAKTNDVDLIIGGKEITDPRVQESVKIKSKIKKLGIEKRVVLPGFVSDDDLQMLYSSAAAFVFPSRYEGFGLPVLEAMLANCPVIAYDNSSIPEVAGDATLLVKDGEPLVDAMVQLLTDKSLRLKLIKLGSARAKKFTWADTAKKTLAVFESAGKSK